MLTDKLLKHVGITDSAVFVGKGRKFQIWNPDNWAIEEQKIREKVRAHRPTLKTEGSVND
jgi:MraZ protein